MQTLPCPSGKSADLELVLWNMEHQDRFSLLKFKTRTCKTVACFALWWARAALSLQGGFRRWWWYSHRKKFKAITRRHWSYSYTEDTTGLQWGSTPVLTTVPPRIAKRNPWNSLFSPFRKITARKPHNRKLCLFFPLSFIKAWKVYLSQSPKYIFCRHPFPTSRLPDQKCCQSSYKIYSLYLDGESSITKMLLLPALWLYFVGSK